MARRECFDAAGLFDPALRASEDRDMWSRIAARYPIAAIRQVLGRKRVVASSLSRDLETTLRSRILMWTKARRLFPDTNHAAYFRPLGLQRVTSNVTMRNPNIGAIAAAGSTSATSISVGFATRCSTTSLASRRSFSCT